MRRRKLILMMLFCVCFGMFGMRTAEVYAKEVAEYKDSIIEAKGFNKDSNVHDGNRGSYSGSSVRAEVTVSRNDGIGALYVEFDRIPKKWTLTNPVSGASVVCGENAFLHEYVDVALLFGELPKTLVMSFEEGTAVAEIYAFSEGEMPEWVQMWQPPCEEADLLLVTSHSDDEQLFFSGMLPYYAGEQGLKVQVAYVVQHFEAYNVANHQRPHEQLDGLWTVGVRNYPVMSDFPDLYAESKDRNVAFNNACAVYKSVGITYDDFVSYITDCLRRFKPLVVVSHDVNGEYGHGTHVVCAAALTEAIEYAKDTEKYPESAKAYGTWEIEKLYLHLYEENPIVMNYDVPLEKFGGKTAFEVSQDGFGCHKSQHWTWFYKWMYGTKDSPIKKATDIKTYSPCNFGLYFTRVGADVIGGDFFENVKSYEVRKAEEEARRLAEEEARRQAEEAARKEAEAKRLAEEEARRQAEEAARKEAEAKRLAEEEAKRAAEEAERLAREEAERLAAELEAKREAKATRLRVALIAVVCVAVCAVIIIAVVLVKCRQRRD